MSQYLIAHISHTNKHNDHITWWNAFSKGYTFCIDKAGLYTEEEAKSICQYGQCIAVAKDIAKPFARSTPYFRKSDGRLAKLYEGDSHTVVPNSAQAWKALFAAQPFCTPRTDKPTPIGVRARAIYLDGIEGGAAA